jgi:hypothetical protein
MTGKVDTRLMETEAVALWEAARAAGGTLFEPELRRAAEAYQARMMELEGEFAPVVHLGDRIERGLRARRKAARAARAAP